MMSVFFLVTQMTNKVWGGGGVVQKTIVMETSGSCPQPVTRGSHSDDSNDAGYFTVIIVPYSSDGISECAGNSLDYFAATRPQSSWTGRGFEELIWGRVEEDSGLLLASEQQFYVLERFLKSSTTWRKLSSTPCATVFEGGLSNLSVTTTHSYCTCGTQTVWQTTCNSALHLVITDIVFVGCCVFLHDWVFYVT